MACSGDAYFASCSRHQASIWSIDIVFLSTFSPDGLFRGCRRPLKRARRAGCFFGGRRFAAPRRCFACGLAGAARPPAPPARAAASMSATLIFERSTLAAGAAAGFGAAGFAAACAPGRCSGLACAASSRRRHRAGRRGCRRWMACRRRGLAAGLGLAAVSRPLKRARRRASSRRGLWRAASFGLGGAACRPPSRTTGRCRTSRC